MTADPAKFPSGFKAVADYVHGQGLKIGIYSAGSSVVCSGRPGSLYNEVIDAQTFASWGVDYNK
jgi:alpha-galactosidase